MGGFAAHKQQRCNSWWGNCKHDFALCLINSLSNGCGIGSWSDGQCARKALPLVACIMH
jgi:hypothetical protein